MCQPQKRQTELLLGTVFDLPCQVLVHLYISPSMPLYCSHLKVLQSVSGSFHGCSCAQVWCQLNCFSSACQSKWSYPTWASLTHSQILMVVIAHTAWDHTSYIFPSILFELLCCLSLLLEWYWISPVDISISFIKWYFQPDCIEQKKIHNWLTFHKDVYTIK